MDNREQAQAAYAQILMDKVRDDTYPSATYMAMIEEVLPPHLASEYIELLLGKVRDERCPSIPMLRRIQRVADELL